MDNGKLQITLAVIAMASGWGVALMTNWAEIFNTAQAGTKGTPQVIASVAMVEKSKFDELQVSYADIETKLESADSQLNINNQKIKDMRSTIQEMNRTIEHLKIPFHRVSDTKLKQLMKFHNASVCYGRSLNLTHNSGEDYQHCEPKEDLAKKLLMFFEELELINNEPSNYSPSRAKDALIQLQGNYRFTTPGWYSDIMLGILIIEYAKKA